MLDFTLAIFLVAIVILFELLILFIAVLAMNDKLKDIIWFLKEINARVYQNQLTNRRQAQMIWPNYPKRKEWDWKDYGDTTIS